MKHDFLDRYSRLDSGIHRQPTGLKLAMALTVVLAVVSAPRTAWSFFGVTSLILLMLAGISRLPVTFLLRRLLLLEPVVLGIAILSLLQPGGRAVFAGILMKGTLCLFTMILLANTTPFAALLAVLRRLCCPAILVTTLALMYRYLFVLMDETERMNRARRSRTFTRQRWWEWKILADVIGQLFVRSTERAERIYAAMCARGWK
ncbi:MAG: cobalt ECF transporter T component CbiQ [Verrucomicrobiota bacterium]